MKAARSFLVGTLCCLVFGCFAETITAETITGTVYDGATSNTLPMVSVIAVDSGGSTIESTTTDDAGLYSMTSDDIVAGDLTIRFSLTDYVATDGTFTVLSGQTTTAESVYLAPESGSTGTISGTIIDATTGNAIASVELSLREGVNDTTSSAIDTTTGDGSGAFQFDDVDAGTYTILAEVDGYEDAPLNVVCIGGQNTSYNHTMSPTAAAGEVRIVLTWGQNPSDLDSHLYTPSGAHIYYASRGSLTGDPYANLDLDDVTSFGPETITIAQRQDGEYSYKVYHFAGSGSLATSGATVKVYDETGLLFSLNVPSSLSDPLWWDVLRFDGSTGRFYTPGGLTLYGSGSSGGSGWTGPVERIEDKDNNSCFISTLR